MAIFNPGINVANPREFIGLSEPIGNHRNINPEGVAANTINPTGNKHVDVSGQLAAEGLGNMISSGGRLGSLLANEADTIVKNELEQRIYTDLNDKRDKFIAGLKGQTAGLAAADTRTLDEVAQAGGDVAGGDEPREVPADVKQGQVTLNKIAAAKKAGKWDRLSLDEYAYNYLKDLRSKYSGWSKEIDGYAEQAGFGNSANKVIAGSLARMNAAAAGQDKELKLQEARAYKAMSDGIITKEEYAAVHNNQEGAFAAILPKVQAYGEREAAAKTAKYNFEAATDEDKLSEFHARKAGEAEADKTVWKNFSGIVNPKTGLTPQQAAKLANEIKSGKRDMSPPDQQALADTMSAAKDNYVTETLEYGYTTMNKAGKTLIAQYGGQEKYTKEVIEPRAKMFDIGIDAIRNKDAGTVFRIDRGIAAATSEAKQRLSGTRMGDFLIRTGALGEILGPAGQQFMPIVAQKGLETFPDAEIGDYLTGKHESTILKNLPGSSGAIDTLKKGIEEVKQKRSDIPNVPKAVDGLFKGYELATSGAYKDFPQVQAALVRGVYDPANKGLLANFDNEYTDANGNVIKGKHAVYKRLTAQSFVDLAVQSDKLYPQLNIANNMREWAGNEFFHLFKQDVSALNDLARTANARVAWDGDTQQYVSMPIPSSNRSASGGPGVQVGQQQAFDRALYNVNDAIKSFSYVVKVSGDDPGKLVAERLEKMGYKAETPSGTSKGQDFGNALLKAIQDWYNSSAPMKAQ